MRRETEGVVQLLWMQHEQLVIAREREERLKADVESAEAEVARNKVAIDGGLDGDGEVVDMNASAGVGTKESPFVMEDGTEEFPIELD